MMKQCGAEGVSCQPPVCLDLCGGLGGWADGFIDAGYFVVGYHVEDWGYPGYLVIQDVRETETIIEYWRDVIDVVVASPPCNEFSWLDLPWGAKARREGREPDMSIVQACLEIGREVNPRLFLMENVRGLQRYYKPAPLHRRSLYFWGDVALVPDLPGDWAKTLCLEGPAVRKTPRRKPPPDCKDITAWSNRSKTKLGPLVRAQIPYEIAYGYALMAAASCPMRML